MYDVVIIGAGPAGLFTAYELITNDPKLKIALIEEGKDTNSRICPMNKLGKPCQNCNPCNIKATTKVSKSLPAPNTFNRTISRTSPNTRDNIVIALTMTVERQSA